MATTANLPPGAVGANGSADHLTTTPLRYAAFDTDHFSLYSTNSPSAARRALEAHLKDTDRRIQDASKLGSALVQQRKDLASKLKEVEQMQQESDMPADLRDKLAELEREYNEVGRESARAFLPKSRVVSESGQENPTVISGSGRESPTKVSAPSRRQRNQPSNRVHDIEFATEISTSLLAQVRQLQAALAEKDEELKHATAARAQLEAEATSLVQRLRHMDENEQKYKDENWNLETRLQEMEAAFRESMEREGRTAQTLKSTQTEKAAKERELDDLKVTHDKLSEDHAMAKKVQEADLHGLRRDAASHETEKYKLQKRIDELIAQNTELAKAVSYRFGQAPQQSDTDFVSAEEGVQSDDQSPLHSEPPSPVKGTPARHGVLETETLKSSLNHAHRMIQNLKNTIHREKTEKIELKRMLQDARDELETRRENAGVTANSAKKRRAEPEGVKFKRPANNGKLGAARGSTTEIIDEPDWEDQDIEQTPSKLRYSGTAVDSAAVGPVAGKYTDAAFNRSEEDTADAFETANERETTTESEAFATGHEDFDDDTEGDATETESRANRGLRSVHNMSSAPKDRRSFMSTASDSGDDDGAIIRTPVHNAQPKYKLRLSRGARRSGHTSEIAPASPSFESNRSPSSSTGTPQPVRMQSLGDELDALDNDSVEGTPVSGRMLDDDLGQSLTATQKYLSAEPGSPFEVRPELNTEEHITSLGDNSQFRASAGDLSDTSILSPPAFIAKPPMVDAGIMTDPWEPERIVEERIVERIVEVEVEPERSAVFKQVSAVAGGALAGLGLGKVLNHDKVIPQEEAMDIKQTSADTADGSADAKLPVQVPAAQDVVTTKPGGVDVGTDAYAEPILPPTRTFVEKGHDAWVLVQPDPQPVAADLATRDVEVLPIPEPVAEQAGLSFSAVVTQDIEPITPELESQLVLITSPKGGLDPAYAEGRGLQAQPEPAVSAAVGMENIPVHTGFDDATVVSVASRQALADAPLNVVQSKHMTDEGSQTLVSGEDIDALLRNKKPSALASASRKDTGSSPIKPSAVGIAVTAATASSFAGFHNRKRDNQAPESQPTIYESTTLRTLRRPTSASSIRSKAADGAPPLPPDHTEKIAAAQQAPPGSSSGQSTIGTMGPPLVPASAYKARPRTPSERPAYERRTSREVPASRTIRAKDSRAQMQTDRISHRTSVSSFASELDERFNITRGQIMYPNDVEPATDPRMIQAITQTMIGEYLWKYTRKAGRSETSSSRHRRFFWVHPYTRTLYWSEQDPSTAGKNMLKAKSVAIEAVRVVSDDNAYPPGLHRKSLVVITPGREVVFTAPTGQRHETWFNALSYLLLRTEREKSEAEDTFDQSDVDEFNPGVQRNARSTINRMTGRSESRQSRQSRASLSSYNSRTTRTTSPQRQDPDRASINLHGTGTVTQRSAQQLAASGGHNAMLTSNARQSSGSVAGRFSSIASRFRPASSHRERASTSLRQPDDPAQIYDASVIADSAEDLRAVIERQERDADRLENVRACCDGKHDVGSLSRTQRHSSFGNRFGSHGQHSHSHPHRT